MTLSDYRTTYSWQAAVELGRSLTRLTEELPAQEERGLIMALQTLMVDLPAAIAADLIDNTTTRRNVILRLQSALEVAERVYPALDQADVQTAVDALVERCQGEAFAEVKPDPAAAEVEVEAETPHEDVVEPEVPAPVHVPVAEEAAAPAPDPSGV